MTILIFIFLAVLLVILVLYYFSETEWLYNMGVFWLIIGLYSIFKICDLLEFIGALVCSVVMVCKLYEKLANKSYASTKKNPKKSSSFKTSKKKTRSTSSGYCDDYSDYEHSREMNAYIEACDQAIHNGYPVNDDIYLGGEIDNDKLSDATDDMNDYASQYGGSDDY